MPRVFAKDRVGTTIKNFIILDWKRENGKTYFYIQCKLCNSKKWMRSDSVLSEKVVSCGCFNKNENFFSKNNILGKRFGKLVVIKETEDRDKYNRSVVWECKCDCGKMVLASAHNLERGGVLSCGCLGIQNSKENMKKARITRDKAYVFETDLTRISHNKVNARNTSGIRGVSWDKARNKWVVTIKFQGKTYNLGRYVKLEDATKAREEAEINVFKKFLDWYYNLRKKE